MGLSSPTWSLKAPAAHAGVQVDDIITVSMDVP